MKFTIIKGLDNKFTCAYSSDYEKMKKLTAGKEYECEIKHPRNYAFHKKYFALIRMVYDNQGIYDNQDDLRHDLTVEAGFYRKRRDMHGNEFKTALSISFSKMEEEEFDDLYNRTLDVIVKYFNFDKQDIIDNIEKYF